ncbi:hypothetical protein [Cohnella herbarum]|uniref:Glycoside hydrolase 123 C-terminal domain-containing protein n=1 Tax=Cohnella herbarum TaxID=2728023 RepID=A0A7Z2VFF0_9BACL|nr:hypothetical protein [Cohnella herbarum]QJD82017.1 hypothetical protein HH215_01680 [Cohnella herbarum]
MRKRYWSAIIMACMIVAMSSTALANSGTGASTSGTWSLSELTALNGQLDTAVQATNRQQLKTYLANVRDDAATVISSATVSQEVGLKTKEHLVYALKLAKDAESVPGLWTNTPFIVYGAPALSPEKRLPNTLPTDGAISDQIRVVSAQGEYEASSFVMAPLTDSNSVTFAVYDLQGSAGTIPSDAVDLRVVNTWYQGGTAWQSYFFDDSKDVLIPELLLHDENLVRTNHQTKRNSVRVNKPSGPQYVDVSGSPPAAFSSYTSQFEDSPVMLPIELKAGESKQMWITTKVPSGTPEGVYTGAIAIMADGVPAGQLTLKIRVLPFELPSPKTYYDLDKDFYTMLYHNVRLKDALDSNGNNVALAETRLLNSYRNLVEHNVVNLPTNASVNLNNPSVFLRQLELMQEAGMDLNPLFGAGPLFPSNEDYSKFTLYLQAKNAYEANPTPANQAIMDQRYAVYQQTLIPAKNYVQQAFNLVSQALGHTNIYFDAWDEAEWNRLLWQQEMWKFVKDDVGAKVFATGHETHFNLETTEDFLNWFGDPTREKADAWHALGDDKIITNYAHPHSGPENPDLMRQRHGMWLYKANYDAVYNYIWYFESPQVSAWSDYVDATYRSFGFVYPTQTDVIDTLAWEGFREGLDDIRYATKLKQLAADAQASGDAGRIAIANRALNWLETMDERAVKSDLIRLEMVSHIMKLIDSESGN